MKNIYSGRTGSYSLSLFLGVTTLAWAGASGQASATILDLTTATGVSGWINGALYSEVSTQQAGSGYGALDAFLKINNQGAPATGGVEGYNTDYRLPPGNGPTSVEFDQFTDHHTRALLRTEVPLVKVGDIKYLVFLLDINEPVVNGNCTQPTSSGNGNGNGGTRWGDCLSLDALQIFIGDEPDLRNFSSDFDGSGYKFHDNATLIYDMDAGGDNWAKLRYWSDVGGSGWADYTVLIPESTVEGDYVYLYSKFGEKISDDRNFEEWGVSGPSSTTYVPEPASLILFGTGLLGLAGTTMRRMKKS